MTSVVAAVIEDNHRLLVTRRQPGVHLAGMWEFPGGKVGPDETHGMTPMIFVVERTPTRFTTISSLQRK